MRGLIVLIPMALVGGYALHQSHERHDGKRSHAEGTATTLVAVTTDPEPVRRIGRAPRIGLGTGMGPEASPAFASVREEIATARARIRAEARASVAVSLDGLLETIAQALDQSIEAGENAPHTDIAVSASALADLAAQLDGLVQIDTGDGTELVLRARDSGAAVRIRIT